MFIVHARQILAALAVCLLAACSAGTSGTVSTSQAAQGVNFVAGACKAVQPVASAVPGALVNASKTTADTANNILSYFNAACGSVEAINAVVAKDPTGGSDSAAWIGGLAAGLMNALPTVAALIH